MKSMITLVPTLNRIKLLRQFLDSAFRHRTSTSGWLIVDKEDYHNQRLNYEGLEMPNSSWQLVTTKAVTMGDKIREVWPDVMAGDYDAVCLLNDDHEIKTDNWDTKLLSKLDGTNFVTCQDNWMSPRKAAGATVWSMELLKAVGFPIYPPGMIHLFIDDLWESIGKGSGCWDIDHSVVVEHHNQLKTPGQRDSTFNKVYGTGPDLASHPLWKNDEKIYQEFTKNDYIAVRQKIRALKGMLEIKLQS